MRVLMINVVCGIRSTGRICTDLAVELEKQGHEVKIAYGRFDVPEKFTKYAVRIGSDNSVKVNALKARLLDNEGLNAVSETKKFLKGVKEYDPDVIHLHNIHGYYLNYPLLFDYLRTCGKKIIWTLHDCWAFTGHTAYCDAIGCEKWKTGCNHCLQIKEYPKAMVDQSERNWKIKREKLIGIPNMTIVTPSNWLAGLVKESFLGDYPVEVIYNGIDISQFQPQANDFKEEHGIADRKMLVGVATAWNENKGYSDYLKLADMLGDGYQVVLVGVTEEQKKALPGNVMGITRTNSIQKLKEIYCGADCYVNLSYCESFGLTNVEAQLCGTPIITYSSGGCVESAGSNGKVVQRGQLDDVRKLIESETTICPSDRAEFLQMDRRICMQHYQELYSK